MIRTCRSVTYGNVPAKRKNILRYVTFSGNYVVVVVILYSPNKKRFAKRKILALRHVTLRYVMVENRHESVWDWKQGSAVVDAAAAATDTDAVTCDISPKNNGAQKAKCFMLRYTRTIDAVDGTTRSPSHSTAIQNALSNRWRIGRLINLVATQYAHPSPSQLLLWHIFQPFKLCVLD